MDSCFKVISLKSQNKVVIFSSNALVNSKQSFKIPFLKYPFKYSVQTFLKSYKIYVQFGHHVVNREINSIFLNNLKGKE